LLPPNFELAFIPSCAAPLRRCENFFAFPTKKFTAEYAEIAEWRINLRIHNCITSAFSAISAVNFSWSPSPAASLVLHMGEDGA
jgi:hypothetical protein